MSDLFCSLDDPADFIDLVIGIRAAQLSGFPGRTRKG
jgi:hypothetical protein